MHEEADTAYFKQTSPKSPYPGNSSILLRRRVNGQPAAIMYPYGQGYVIATTFYTDVASGMSHASEEEKASV